MSDIEAKPEFVICQVGEIDVIGPDGLRTVTGLLFRGDADHVRSVAAWFGERVRVIPVDDLATLRAKLEEAGEALEPFATIADEVDRLRHEDDSTCLHRISAAVLRRARATLASIKGGEDA